MENEEYFSFTFFTSLDHNDQIIVKVFRPENTGIAIQNVGHQLHARPNENQTRELIDGLSIADIALDPPQNELVLIGQHLRIDSQPVAGHLWDAGVWRNIHIQNEDRSYAVLKIWHGAQLCYLNHRQHQLLRYIKEGLWRSWEDAFKYLIRVTIERRNKKQTRNWNPVKLTGNDIKGLENKIVTRLNQEHNMHIKLVKNISKIANKTDMIEHVAAAIRKRVAKVSEKEAAHIVGKKIPVVSTFVGIVCGITRAIDGDVAGALSEVASGVLADLPGLGTAASVAIDASLLTKDIVAAIRNEKDHIEFTELQIEELQLENKGIKDKLTSLSPGSSIFGEGFYSDSAYDESEIAYTDDISKIHVYSSDFINGIQIEYKVMGPMHFHGDKRGTLQTMDLTPNQKITKVEVTTCLGAVSSLAFYTDTGNEQSFGEQRGSVDRYEFDDGYYLAAIKGYNQFIGDDGQGTYGCPKLSGRHVVPAIGFTAKC